MEYTQIDGDTTKVEILVQAPEENIGLEQNYRHLIVEILNYTLANESVLAVKTRNTRCEVGAAGFIETHLIFDTHYRQINEIIDAIAERAWMLGAITISGYQEFIHFTRQEEQSGFSSDIPRLLANHQAIIRYLREDARRCQEEFQDETMYELLAGVMLQHEEMACALSSLVDHKTINAESQERIWEDE